MQFYHKEYEVHKVKTSFFIFFRRKNPSCSWCPS